MINKIRWSIDNRLSEIGFKIKNMKIAQVRGHFQTVDSQITTTGNSFQDAKVQVFIQAESINTGNPTRDENLRGADFLDVAHHKQITFQSTSLEIKEGKRYHELWGELTIKGITKLIVLKIEIGELEKDPWGNETADIKIRGKIKRLDWEIGLNSPTGDKTATIGKNIKINCEVELHHHVKPLAHLVPESEDGHHLVF